MNTLEQLNDALTGEMMMQSMYNKHMMNIAVPDVRQLFTQLRDAKMQHITQLQQQIQQLMSSG